MNTRMDEFDEGGTFSLESFDLDAFERASAGLYWEELQVGEYHIWLRGGLRYEMNWEYGFQHQPPDRPHGPLKGPLFERSPSKPIGDFDIVKAIALEVVRLDSLETPSKINSNRF
jgi:hypothetical protein